MPTVYYANAVQREKALFWFFDNKKTIAAQMDLTLAKEKIALPKTSKGFGQKEYEEGKAYYEGGSLTRQGERSWAMKRILYYLEKSGIAAYPFAEEKFELAWEWLKANHNAYSGTWNTEGWLKCRTELHDKVYAYDKANPSWSSRRRIMRQARFNQEPSLKRISCIVAHILYSEGGAGVSTDGSSVNIRRLDEKFKQYVLKAKADKTFSIPDLTNYELKTGVNRKTLYKHRDMVHDLWLQWDELQK